MPTELVIIEEEEPEGEGAGASARLRTDAEWEDLTCGEKAVDSAWQGANGKIKVSF